MEDIELIKTEEEYKNFRKDLKCKDRLKTKVRFICSICNTEVIKSYKAVKWPMVCSHCNRSIAAYSEKRNSKRINTTRERYGVDNVAQSDIIKNKMKETCRERYGTDYAITTDSVRDKIKTTMMEHYGVEHPIQNENIKEKAIHTILEKYGAENVMHNREVQDKQKSTMLERYGVEYPIQNKEVMQGIIQTVLEKYGVNNVMKNDIVKEKTMSTNMDKYGVKWPVTSQDVQDKSNETRKNKLLLKYKNNDSSILNYNINTKTLLFKCEQCGETTEINKSLYNYRFKSNTNPCINCNPIDKRYSFAEKSVVEFIKEIYSGQVVENERTILNGKKLDIYIPDRKLAIEYDGLFWHNELNKPDNYHVNKTNVCENNGIQLIHIFEDEWIYKQDIVKSRLSGLLGLNKRIYARKCVLKEVSYSEAEKFLSENHIQGNCISKYRYGLYNDEELVSLMTFGNSRFKQGEFELLRFCNKLNTNVIGGASKLFKYFLDTHVEISSIISFADRRWSTGRLYEKLGFTNKQITSPSYYYVIDDIRHNRVEFQKHKLIEMGFDKDKSEHDIMLEQEIFRIYDCGNLKYTFSRYK